MTIIKVLEADGHLFTSAVIGDDDFALRYLERLKLANTNNVFTFQVETVQQEFTLEDLVEQVGAMNDEDAPDEDDEQPVCRNGASGCTPEDRCPQCADEHEQHLKDLYWEHRIDEARGK